jgi:hypothetical protein
MSTMTLNPQQLRLLVEEKWQKDDEAVAVGLHVTGPWQGPKEVEFDFGKAQIVHADTVFQVREALLSAERAKDRIILLTKLQQGDLGHDVVARLARSRLFPIDHWASLCSLFKAKELDRSICDQAIAQALLEYAPPDGYPPVSAGVLDAGTVWRAICRHVFDMGEREPDLVTLILWATSRSGSSRYASASEELRDSLRHRLVGNLGDAADSILRFVENGTSADALALGVVCQVVFGEGEDTTLDAAAARIEQYHNNKPIPEAVGRILGRVAAEAIADLDRKDDPRPAQQHLQRADELLRQFRCDEFAYRNRLTLLGYEQRLSRLGDEIVSATDAYSKEAVERCGTFQRQVAIHRLARLGRRAEQVARTEMALRLVRWLSQPLPTAPGFPELANAYLKELSFVDWARESICRGEEVAGLTRAYQRLDQSVLARREEFNRTFAQALADWTAVGSKFTGICGVEDVLAQVVAKIAEASNNVLLLVLDGMSWAVCHELLSDIRQDHWFEATLDSSSLTPAPVIATVPSITGYSRASLLSGHLTKGDAAVEKRNFEANPALRQVCDKRYPPLLFHKKEVTEGTRGVVGEELTRAVLSPNNRVVGVVINAIDDRLSSAQQIRDDWSINRISPLGPLLKLARDSGRVVVLVSDHGHVWHRPDARLLAGEAGTRWRPKSDTVQDGEIVITGSRVRDDSGQNAVVVPWVETIYYGRQQNGYHGGATPQEMVCSLVILTDKSSAYSGLYPCEYPKPDWWSPAPVATAVVEEPITPTGQKTLFDHLPEDEQPQEERTLPEEKKKPVEEAKLAAWIGELLSSQAYKTQKELVRRHAPDDELVRRCLAALDASGGIMTPAAFSKAARVPAGRLDGLVAVMQRVLNVDGYEILTFSRAENRVELNAAKLKRQFDLE